MLDHPSHTHETVPAPSAAAVRDPVCGMAVDPATAKHHTEYKGAVHYFCSGNCVAKFIADPNYYLNPDKSMAAQPAQKSIFYTCPMHPQIRRMEPGNCPICGMALEPVRATEDTGPSAELIAMTRRFWIGAALALPTVLLEMGAHFPGLNLHDYISPQISTWIQFVLATPAVLWAGWPFFERGWASVRNRSLNMFSLISLGTGAAYLYSLAATFVPGLFPERVTEAKIGSIREFVGVVQICNTGTDASRCSGRGELFWHWINAPTFFAVEGGS